MPRRYKLGQRADQMAITRARIVQAAVELYTERGISATTMKDIAERADVAPGTVANHFSTREDLDRAIVERAVADMASPDPSIFEGCATLAERLAVICREAGVFLERAAPWYRMWLREPMLGGPWDEAGAAAGARWDALFRATLGPLADDVEAMVVLRASMTPGYYDAVRSGVGTGHATARSTEETAELIAAVLTAWLEPRSDALSAGG